MSIQAITKILFFLFLLQSCSSSKTTRSMEYYDPDNESNISLLNLPIRLYKSDLEKRLNQQVAEVLYEDSDFNDGLMIKATRQSAISLEIADRKVGYQVPVQLWLRKDLVITSVDAEGSLNLIFETAYEVNPDWQLSTKTVLKSYEWIEAPVVKLGIGNLNVTSIANQFIDKAEGQITTAIDEQVKNLIDLKREINQAWQELQKPILVSEEYKSWLVMNPDTVRLTPLETEGDLVEGTVVITSRPRIFVGEKPLSLNEVEMPNFRYVDKAPKEDFSIFMGSQIPFEEAERIVKTSMVGETYSYGKRKVTVEALELYSKGNKLAVKTSLSGSYEGDVFFTGQPEYNDRKNEITFKNVDFDFTSKKALMKTASWLFKGSLKKRIQENLNFHITENIEATQKAIEKELEDFELAPGVKLLGNLEELQVSHVYISATGINVKVGLQGNLLLEIKEVVVEGENSN